MNDTGILVKLGIFLLVTILSTVLMVNTLNQPVPGDTYSYSARFDNVEGLTPGSAVRMAGVRVGKVTGVSQRDGIANVRFEVQRTQQVTSEATAHIRYADLLGSRYLAIGRGASLNQRLRPGSTIPLARTKPAVDLTALLNGFRPLFDTLEPEQANQLARSLIRVFDGQRAPITDVLHRIVSLTSKITKDGPLLGRLLHNVNSVIGSLLGRKQQFTDLVAALDKLMRVAVHERGQFSDVLDSTTHMANALAGVTDKTGKQLTNSLGMLNRIAGTLSGKGSKLVTAFRSANKGFEKLGNLTNYGSWANVYLCSARIRTGPLNTKIGPDLHSKVCR